MNAGVPVEEIHIDEDSGDLVVPEHYDDREVIREHMLSILEHHGIEARDLIDVSITRKFDRIVIMVTWKDRDNPEIHGLGGLDLWKVEIDYQDYKLEATWAVSEK